MYEDLKGKVAIVTGSARGIGFACAKLLAQHGASAVIADVRQELAQESADSLKREGLEAFAVSVDVSSEESVEAMVEAVIKKYGRIDIVVNNAGIIDASDALQLTAERWNRLISINLTGAQLVTRACLKRMIGQGSGKLVFMASRAGEMGSPLVAPSYCASKGGMLALMKSYALYCAPHNITANAVAPGFIETDMTKGRDDPNSVPIKRLGTPLDVAKAVYFLSSELSDYITGNTVDVNGGLYISR